MLNLESDVMRDPGSINSNIVHWIFFLFSRSKASDANIDIIANVVYLWKPQLAAFHKKN